MPTGPTMFSFLVRQSNAILNTDMKIIFAIFIFVVVAGPAFGRIDEAWMICKESSDCTLARGQCGEVKAANRKYLSQFETETGVAPCDSAVDFANVSKKYVAECIKNKCLACSPAGSKGRCKGL